MTFRTKPPALTPLEMYQAAQLYRDEGKSRRQVAAILRASETAVTTALRHLGVPLRNQREAAAAHNRARRGYYRKSQLVSSVFHLSQQGGQRNGK